jgi:NitT/TauT family transport system substrate-binding protein
MQIMQTRRHFLTTLSGAGAATLFDSAPSHAAEGPPETTSVRFTSSTGAICLAPQYVAEDLLRAEGFTDVQMGASDPSLGARFPRGFVDFEMNFASTQTIWADAGERITVLTGVHPACFELFGNDRIHRILDLKGKRVGVKALGSSPHVFLSIMVAYVGLDPVNDIEWVTTSPDKPAMELFAEGRVDAFLGFPPDPQILLARKIGHVVVNSTVDRPWSQYYCCTLAADTDYVQKYPIATKRVLRAILKATDLCASQPSWVAQQLLNKGLVDRYEYALSALTDVPYNVWREYDPEDTIRFYALRLHEAGMIKSGPDKIIADGTDWRFLREVRRELG